MDHLLTEGVNPAMLAIDTLSSLEIVQLINAEDAEDAEDAEVAEAVRLELPSIARAVDISVGRVQQGGHML